jgi:hypothetical protein
MEEAGINERKRVRTGASEVEAPNREQQDEYTFRKLSGCGRTARAPRRTTDGDHLGILNGRLPRGSLQPEQIGGIALRAEVGRTNGT